MTGSDRERELVNTLEATGYAAIRCPSSGSATSRDLPDVLAGTPRFRPTEYEEYESGILSIEDGETLSDPLAIELKSGSSTTLYVEEAEVESLESFAERFGSTPLLAARYTSQSSPVKIYGVAPSDARKTDSGAYGLPESDIAERATVIWTPPVGDRAASVEWV